MVAYAKLSPKMFNPRDIAGKAEDEEEDQQVSTARYKFHPQPLKMCQIVGAEVFVVSHHCDLE